MNIRKQKASLVTWLLFLAIAGVLIVVGMIGLELLIRWVSLGRIQSAAREAAMTYARDQIRLRDNRLSVLNAKSLTYQQAGIAGLRTPVIGEKARIPGAEFGLEYLNASQILLYNIWGTRIKDASQVDNVGQRQCYKPHRATRFSLNPNSPLNECNVLAKVTSPVMSLTWTFETAPYGFGACCAAPGGNNTDKDFCVKLSVKGRMDPILAGGLPFLQGIPFIRDADFNISKRVVVKKMSALEDTADTQNTANNLSGETIFIEDVPANLTCAATAPPMSQVATNNIAPQINNLANLPDPIVELQNYELPQFPFQNCPPPTVPSCPQGTILKIISQGQCSVNYSCIRPY